MKDKIFGVLQRVGRSFMLPVAVLPIAGVLLGLGSSFTNETTLETYHLMGIMGPGTLIYTVLTVMNQCGSVIFDNLPVIFAVGVAIGMAKKEKEVAALAAMIAYLVMNAAISSMITITGGTEQFLEGATGTSLGITTFQMGAFGGIIVGLGVAALHNKFYKIELPAAFAFFQGTRFVPIICTLVYVFVGILLFFVWQPIQIGINALGTLVLNSGLFGTFLFGMIKRLLIPFGLHHVFYMPFWQTAIGGSMEVAGKTVVGAQNIFFAQLADPTTVHFATAATRYFSGEFVLYIFGLPGAAFAMYRCSRPEKRREAGGLLLSAALTSALTGITEPLEFSFLFVAPLLFGINAIFAGLAYALAQALNIAVGLTFSGGFIDLFMFGILQGNSKTSWLLIIPLGIAYFVVYYFIFALLIKKMDLKTPGREADDEETKLYSKADYQAKVVGENGAAGAAGGGDALSAAITAGLGGKANISDVDCCATRLRCTVHDGSKVSDTALKATGAAGVVHKGNGVQVIYGPRVTTIKSNLEEYLLSAASDQAAAAPAEPAPAPAVQEAPKAESKPDVHVQLSAPITGKLMTLPEVNDGVFSEGMLGDGFAIEPSEGKVYAPCDCTVETVFDTKHAIGLSAAKGVELLIHIGIDTVKLNGEGYDIVVKEGDELKTGDLIGTFDMELIRKAGYRLVTPVLVTNTDDYNGIMPCPPQSIQAGEPMCVIR